MTRTDGVRHGFERVGDLWLHHLDLGGEGHPILLLHGVTGCAWDWHHVARELTPLGAVRALDLRGHGDSRWSPAHAYASEELVRDLLAHIDSTGANEVDLVGYSWGALVAIGAAVRSSARVHRLAIIDVEASFDQGETDLPQMSEALASEDEALGSLRAFNPNAPEDLLELVSLALHRPGPDGTVFRKHDPFFLTRWPFRSDDRWNELPLLSMPTLLVHAGASFVRREVMERMADAIPNADLVEIPDANHVVPVDTPSPLAGHLSTFLG